MKIQFAKYKCDQCGDTIEVEEMGMPSPWFNISIVEWAGTSGRSRLENDVCSEKCALELLKALKEIPKEEEAVIF